jgi:hypothetical protein
MDGIPDNTAGVAIERYRFELAVALGPMRIRR